MSKDILKESKKDLEVHSWLNKNPNFVDKTKILLAGIWTSVKAEVLISIIRKKELANEYEEQINKELIEFKKNQKHP
ncbi:hypothetical protein GJU41_19455 [Bacillus idriensis]|uniref:Uncharacterized protein n=1 Tax=Metabacillus idriensis TaxID=324768 RepID=A0A6I2MCZ2_9BACI|nr:hypothetical protein [Metabacillus idriensis]MRX56138.1 hypothetical protein [Metabacillus idriensis]